MLIHLIIAQLVREGITVSMKIVVSQAFFVINALTAVGSRTAYQAVYGRQPPMLPPLEGISPQDTEDGRKEQRVRQIAINEMVQVSALNQTRRALAGKTSSSGSDLYKPGDWVDYHRKSSDKDVSGWRGPAQVINNIPEQGGVTVHDE